MVRTIEPIVERRFLAGDVVRVPAGSVGRVLEAPGLFGTRWKVTFAVGVGRFHDEVIDGSNLESVSGAGVS